MTGLNRRDFLLHLAPLAIALAILLSGEEAFAQMKPFQLQTPRQNQSFAVGEQVQIVALIRTQYPRLLRVDFRANGTFIGSGTWRTPRITWTPVQAGNYTITAEAILLQGNVISTATTNVSILTVLYDKLGSVGNWGWNGSDTLFASYYEELNETNEYVVSTQFAGTLTNNFVIRRLEFAVDYVNSRYFNDNTGTQIPLGSLATCKIKVWDESIYGFQANAVAPSLVASVSPGLFTAGSTTTPVGLNPGPNGSRPVYVVGWNNLSINLPSNKPLQLSIQCPVNAAVPNIFAFYKSVFPGGTTLGASRAVGGSQQNQTVNGSATIKILGSNF